RYGRNREAAEDVVRALLAAVKIGFDDPGAKTQYLLYVGEREVESIADLAQQHWETLAALAPSIEGRGARSAKKAASDAVPAPISNALRAALGGGKAADLAPFGRMLADLPD